jgi:hypothetical protein
MTTTIDKRLSKLEALASDVLPCDWCRATLEHRPLFYTTAGLAPGSFISVSCRWCGWYVVYGVGDLDAREVETLTLYFNAAPGDRFRDPRVFASEHWFSERRNGRKWLAAYRRFKEGLPPVERKRLPAHASRPADKVGRKAEEAKREREALLDRGRTFTRLMRSKERKEFGPHSFPLAMQVKAIQDEEVETYRTGGVPWGETVARKTSKCFRVVELCEVALWGAVLPETREALAEVSAALEAFEAERERAAEQKAREEAERAEARAREMREYESRVRPVTSPAPVGTPASVMQAAPVSRFRKTGSGSPLEPARMVAFPSDVAGNSVGPDFYDPNDPADVGFMRNTPETLDEPEDIHTPGFIRRGDEKPSPAPASRYYRPAGYDGDPRY